MFKLQNGYINPKYIVSLDFVAAHQEWLNLEYELSVGDKWTAYMSGGNKISLTKEEYEELSKLWRSTRTRTSTMKEQDGHGSELNALMEFRLEAAARVVER